MIVSSTDPAPVADTKPGPARTDVHTRLRHPAGPGKTSGVAAGAAYRCDTRSAGRGRGLRLVALSLLPLLAACTPHQLLRIKFGDHGEAAERVAMCESRMDPNAVSPGGGNHGLFQINSVHARTWPSVTGLPWSARLDPVANIDFAFWLSDGGTDWSPWTCQP